MRDLAPYLAQAFQATSPLVKRWMGDDAVRRALEREFRETIALRVESLESAARYAAFCPVPGAVPTDYRLREIVVEDDLSVLAGIHFYGRDVAFPFVGVFAASRTPEPQEYVRASRRLATEFQIFRPPLVRWWTADVQFDPRTLPGAVGDQRVVAGSLSELLAGSRPETTVAAVRLEPETEAEGYDRYSAALNEFLDAHPHCKSWLSMTSREEFQECEAVGGLHAMWVGDAYAGVIAALPKALRGIAGWEIVEEVVTASNRGRGLAPVMQRLLLERLDPNRGAVIFGTIDDRNRASLKTALRVGRREVGGWTFLPAA